MMVTLPRPPIRDARTPLWIGGLLLLLIGCQPEPQPIVSASFHGGPQVVDVTVHYPAGTKFPMSGQQTDKGRGDTLRKACQITQPVVLELSPKTFDLDGQNKGTLFLPDHVTLTCPAGIAVLKSTIYSDGQGAAVEIKNALIENMRLVVTSADPLEDAQAIKFWDGATRTADGRDYADKGATSPTPNYKATLRHCEISVNDWGLYDWMNEQSHVWRLEDCVIKSGRQCVSMVSNNARGRVCELIRCTLDVDASRSQSVGATSNIKFGGVNAVVCKSGLLRLVDCEFHLRGKVPEGPSWTPRCVGVTDSYASPSDDRAKIELHNCRFYADSNGASTVSDVYLVTQGIKDKLIISGGWGSGEGGAVTRNW